MTDDDRLICTQPFTWCEVHGDGSVFACCPSWLNVPLGNLLQTPWGDIWNGAIAKGLRCSVLDETFVQCNHTRCPRLAGPSAPVMTLKDVKPATLRHLLHHKMTHLPFGPRKINLCYDHRCNLACPSCRRDFMLVGKRAEGRMHQIEARLRRFIGPELEEMTVAGFGDPFGSPSYRSLLQGLDKSVFPRLQIIRLHTNGLLWDQGMWTSMPYASDLVRTAEISIDAADASTYAINRRGGDFSQLLSNLAFIATLNVAVKLSFVVQQNNYREIPDFVALAHGFGFEVYFSQLVNWGTFSHQDYASRAVHCQAHPEHVAFLGILKDVADLERVDIGNLRPLLGAVAD
jgi:MoaA/NifB/PqqE/SkfB family radical SAM enzyme